MIMWQNTLKKKLDQGWKIRIEGHTLIIADYNDKGAGPGMPLIDTGSVYSPLDDRERAALRVWLAEKIKEELGWQQ